MTGAKMDNEQFSLLLNYFSFSWEGYQKVKKGVKKRIARHMNQAGCRDMRDYIRRLEEEPGLKYECECLLSVPVSRFFRDPGLWKVLQEKILPRFFSKKILRVWSAGCACGEEVYSFKIIWHALEKHHSGLPALQVTASDLNPESLDRAQKGVYQASGLKEVPKDMLNQYFEKGARRSSWEVSPRLKTGITWEQFHLLHDRPPKAVYDIIFLRNNILLYAAKEAKAAGFNSAVSALTDDGILVIGTKDRLPPERTSGFKSLELPYVLEKISHSIHDGRE